MGRFSTTIQIKNNANKEEFIKLFCGAMKKRGFSTCSEDEAAVSYLLGFGGGWVTLTNEDYSNNPKKAETDVSELSKEMKSAVISVEVVDSDFAILNFNGDMVIVGDGSGYGFEEAPKGDRKLWEPLLAEGKTWEEFSESVNKDEVFAEDALWEVAKVLGIEPRYICSDHRDFSETADEDENITAFYFKKAVPLLTLNAAFNKVFGEGLEPLGFKRLKKIKNKQPYYARLVNGEILHIVTYRTLSSHKPKYKRVEILGGAVTVYRGNLDFLYHTLNPRMILPDTCIHFCRYPELEVDEDFMKSVIKYNYVTNYKIKGLTEEEKIRENFGYSISDFYVSSENSEEMLKNLDMALNVLKNVTLQVLDNVTDLDSCVDYFKRTGNLYLCPFDEFLTEERYENSEGLLMVKTNYRNDGIKEMEEKLALLDDAAQQEIDQKRKEYDTYRIEQIALRDEMIDDPELNKRVLDELERRKTENIEKLRSYGLFDEPAIKPAPKPEPQKPMTLNAAFKKVFGEALAPLGYQPVKGKYPYLVRVIPGGEIIHVITCEESLCSYPPRRKFDIVGGIATVYRYRIDLDQSPKHNGTWLNSIGSFYARTVSRSEYDQKTCESLDGIKYNENDNSSLLNAMNKSLELANKHMLPYLNRAVDLKSSLNCIKVLRQKCSTNNFSYPLKFEGCGNHDEGFLYIKTDDETLKTGKNKFFTDPEVLAELDRRKAANTEILRSCGSFDEPEIKIAPKPEPQKPMTLNAAFIKVFGEGLEPFGFKKVKSRQPYFARVIGGEIIHIFSVAKKKHGQKIGGKTFEILCGIATVYRREIDLNVKPEDSWLKNISKIYSGYHPFDRDIEYNSKIWGFDYDTPIVDMKTFETSFSASELTDSLNRAFDEVKKTILPIFDEIRDLMSCKKYFDFIGWPTQPDLNFVGEGLLDAKVFSSAEEFYQHTLSNSMREMKIKEFECRQRGFASSSVLKEFENMKETLERSCFHLFNDPEFQAKAPAELDRRKTENIEKLRSYGLFDEPVIKIAPKPEPEKPMTLNAAFKKVFGESLEPLGFKLIKSKYPYFVRVVNDEIIHYVTVGEETADGRGWDGVKYKCFNVFCGVSTVYNSKIDFDTDPGEFHFNGFDSVSEIYTKNHWYDLDMEYRTSIMRFYYIPTDENSLISALKKVLAAAEMYVLPVIGQAMTLEKCMDYFGVMDHSIRPFLEGGGEGLLCTRLFSVDEFVMFCGRSGEREIERCRRELDSNSNLSPKKIASLEERIEYIMSGREEGKKKCYEIFTDPELREKAPAELERRKKENTEKLRGYGLDI